MDLARRVNAQIDANSGHVVVATVEFRSPTIRELDAIADAHPASGELHYGGATMWPLKTFTP